MAAAIVRVRKSSAQTAHVALSDSAAGALNVFSATLCGRSMILGEWTEVVDGTGWSRKIGHGPAFLLQPCIRCAAKLAKIRDEAHAEAIAEDIRRFPGWTDADDRIETARAEELAAKRADAQLAARIAARSADEVAVLADEDAASDWADQRAAQTSARTLSPDAYVIAEYRSQDGTMGTRHIVARIYSSDSGDSFRPTDGARYSDDPYGDASQYSGFQGSADTLCGTIAYGVTYAPHQGPAVTCQDCQRAQRLLWPAEETSDVRANDYVGEAPAGWGILAEETSVTVETGWGTVATDSLPAASPVTIERDGRTMRVRADEIVPGDVAPVDGVVGTVTGGPVDVAVTATAALLGSSEEEARAHLRTLYRSVVVDTAAQDVIAAAYDALPERDTSPLGARGVLAWQAWQAMAEETLRQAAVLRALGVHWTVVDTDPYVNAGAMFAELRATGGIRVLSSRATGGHPVWTEEVNDTFRAVHDILGHAATGRGFDRHGEEAAYQAHAALFSPLARQALATETRGQNASMLRAGGVFPPQKIAVLPEWARATDALKPRRSRYSDEERATMRDDAARDHAAQGLGEWAGR